MKLKMRKILKKMAISFEEFHSEQSICRPHTWTMAVDRRSHEWNQRRRIRHGWTKRRWISLWIWSFLWKAILRMRRNANTVIFSSKWMSVWKVFLGFCRDFALSCLCFDKLSAVEWSICLTHWCNCVGCRHYVASECQCRRGVCTYWGCSLHADQLALIELRL